MDFLDRVFRHDPRGPVTRYQFQSWRQADRPTSEGLGVLPLPGVDVERLASNILDVDRYVGNVDHVVACQGITDERFSPPLAVRFYQRIKVPVLGEIHMELVLTDHGEREGYRVLAWHQLDPETSRLDTRRGARSAYNNGAWLLKPDAVGYALSSAPQKGDVGRLKFAALTRGADATAAQVIKANIEGMVRWSRGH